MQVPIQMTQAQESQQNSIPSSEPVPQTVSQQTQVQSAQPSYQIPSAPQVEAQPQAPQVQVQDQSPWQEAFNKLSDSLSAKQSSQPQAAYSTPTPQAPTAPSYPSTQSQAYQAAPSVTGQQTYLPQVTQESYQTQQAQAQTSNQQEVRPSQDGYLGAISDESLEVIQHFGLETPALFNRYSCVVEDALLEQAKHTAQSLQQVETLTKSIEGAKKVVSAAAEDNAEYHVMLTNPDMFSEYVNEFFGPNGPHPVEKAAPAADGRFVGQQFQNVAPQAAQQAPAPQRPEMPAPPQPQVDQGNPEQFWNSFGNLADRDPQNAWKYLNAAQQSPELFVRVELHHQL